MFQLTKFEAEHLQDRQPTPCNDICDEPDPEQSFFCRAVHSRALCTNNDLLTAVCAVETDPGYALACSYLGAHKDRP